MAVLKNSNRDRITPRPEIKSGIAVGSLSHRILLALRAPGGLTTEQVYLRFCCPSQVMCAMKRAGLIVTPPSGAKDGVVALTAAGRAIVDPDGPLARRKTLINYCHL